MVHLKITAMKRLLAMLFVSISLAGFAQESIPLWVVASAGANESNSDISISWTMGEPASTTLGSDQGLMLTQGFQQGDLFLTDIEDVMSDMSLTLRVYPNPVKSTFNILVSSEDQFEPRTTIEIIDITGRRIDSKIANIIPGIPYPVDARNMNVGLYIVKIINGNRTQVVKLVKE